MEVRQMKVVHHAYTTAHIGHQRVKQDMHMIIMTTQNVAQFELLTVLTLHTLKQIANCHDQQNKVHAAYSIQRHILYYFYELPISYFF